MAENLKLEIWKEYEKIAMHFNTLLIQLRMRALGGLGVIVALIGFVSRSSESDELQWGLLGASFLVLSIVWFAIFLLDYFYYNKLLLGAVSSTLDLEKDNTTSPEISFSTDVKTYMEGRGNSFSNLWPIFTFYMVVLGLLILCCVYSFCHA